MESLRPQKGDYNRKENYYAGGFVWDPCFLCFFFKVKRPEHGQWCGIDLQPLDCQAADPLLALAATRAKELSPQGALLPQTISSREAWVQRVHCLFCWLGLIRIIPWNPLLEQQGLQDGPVSTCWRFATCAVWSKLRKGCNHRLWHSPYD